MCRCGRLLLRLLRGCEANDVCKDLMMCLCDLDATCDELSMSAKTIGSAQSHSFNYALERPPLTLLLVPSPALDRPTSCNARLQDSRHDPCAFYSCRSSFEVFTRALPAFGLGVGPACCSASDAE